MTTWWRRLTGRASRTGGSAAAAPAKRADRPRKAGPAQPTTAARRRQVEVDRARPVLGATATPTGWVGALVDADGHGTPAILTAPDLRGLVAAADGPTVVAVDVPIGLPDRTRREADVQTRAFLAGQGSAVFTTPVREAVYAATYGEANALNRERLGSGVSKQAYELRRRIMEVDAWVREDLPCQVVEVHPEASFAELAGAILPSRRRSAEGAQERRAVLARGGIHVPASAPHGVATDDLLDACAAAWSAHRVKTGRARTFPTQPETFSDGLPAAVHA